MGRCRSSELKLNPDKCKIKEQKIKLYGVVCGQDGIQPDPSNNVKELSAKLIKCQSSVFWRNLNKEIEGITKECRSC